MYKKILIFVLPIVFIISLIGNLNFYKSSLYNRRINKQHVERALLNVQDMNYLNLKIYSHFLLISPKNVDNEFVSEQNSLLFIINENYRRKGFLNFKPLYSIAQVIELDGFYDLIDQDPNTYKNFIINNSLDNSYSLLFEGNKFNQKQSIQRTAYLELIGDENKKILQSQDLYDDSTPIENGYRHVEFPQNSYLYLDKVKNIRGNNNEVGLLLNFMFFTKYNNLNYYIVDYTSNYGIDGRGDFFKIDKVIPETLK